jgi:septal ring factor EnvC (AmiA/AmiB activator)
MVDADKLTIFALATKNEELQRQLAQAQDRLVETAIEAGHLHARIEALEAQLAQAERDAGKAQASRVIETGFSVASLRPAPRVHEARTCVLRSKPTAQEHEASRGWPVLTQQ